MTHDEFIERAYNPPYEDEPVIYRLAIDTLFYDAEESSEPYGFARISENCLEGYFLMLDEAQREVERLAGDSHKSDEYYRFVIYETPIGLIDGRGAAKRIWIYDGAGKFECHIPWSNLDKDFMRYDRFYGQPDERQRFEIGDVVEFKDLNNSKLRLGIIERIPRSPEDIWQRNKHGDDQSDISYNDGSDCVYIVWFGPDEEDWDYMWDNNLMPPSFPDSPKIKELKEAYRQYNANSK